MVHHGHLEWFEKKSNSNNGLGFLKEKLQRSRRKLQAKSIEVLCCGLAFDNICAFLIHFWNVHFQASQVESS
jgi:hypothetical protein